MLCTDSEYSEQEKTMQLKKQFAAVIAASCLLACGRPAEPEVPENTEPPAPSADPDVTRAEGIAADLDLKQKIEQLIVISIYSYNGEPFRTMNSEVEEMFAAHQYGGIILFDENMSSAGQTAGLNYDLQRAAVQNNGVPLLIAVDQEGGSLARGNGITSGPGNMALGASGEAGLAASAASILAGEIGAMGFNTDFAPDADVNNEPANPVIGIRSFSDDPLRTAELASAFAKSLNDNGIISCGKHYPGHGNVTTDSHTGLPVSDLTLEELRNNELIPFARLCSEGTDMIMTAHICYPEIEPETYVSKYDGSTITLPATLSRTLIQDVLRGELGFDGVVSTDSLLMDAIRTHFDPADAAALALNAGADILLMPVEISDSAGAEALDAYVDAIASMVGDRIPEERINEAVIRVLTMKAKRGVLDYNSAADRDKATAKAEAAVGSAENAESERAIADQCVTAVKNESVLPLSGSGHILLAGVQESQRAVLEYGFNRLAGETGWTADTINLSYGKSMPADLSGYDAVAVTSWLDNMSQFDPAESIMIPQIQTLIQNAHAAGIPCIVISTGLPYDLSCYGEADSLLAVYNPTGIRYDEAGALIGSIGANIPAALDVIFGHAHPVGTLPVDIPEVSGTGFTETVVYPRGSGLTW